MIDFHKRVEEFIEDVFAGRTTIVTSNSVARTQLQLRTRPADSEAEAISSLIQDIILRTDLSEPIKAETERKIYFAVARGRLLGYIVSNNVDQSRELEFYKDMASKLRQENEQLRQQINAILKVLSEGSTLT